MNNFPGTLHFPSFPGLFTPIQLHLDTLDTGDICCFQISVKSLPGQYLVCHLLRDAQLGAVLPPLYFQGVENKAQKRSDAKMEQNVDTKSASRPLAATPPFNPVPIIPQQNIFFTLFTWPPLLAKYSIDKQAKFRRCCWRTILEIYWAPSFSSQAFIGR